MEVYQVDFVEPQSGKLRKVYFYHGIEEMETKLILEVAFDTGPIVGFTDEEQVSYPVSALVRMGKSFSGHRLTLLVGSGELSAPDDEYRDEETSSNTELEELVLTEDNAEKAFVILDKNGDGYVHMEEIVDVLTVSYTKFLQYNPRFSFAYSCITPANIAIATAQSLLSSVDPASGDCSLNFDDFCAWYLSGGTHPLRELMIFALEFISSTQPTAHSAAASPAHTMKRSKSATALNLGSLYSDAKVAEFTSKCQNLLRLSVGGSLSYLLDLIAISVKGRSVISHEMYTKVLYVYFLHQDYQLTAERDADIVEILDMIFDMLSSSASNEKVHLLDLGSLLCAVSNGKYLQALKTLFDLYPDSHQGFVTENILSNHLCQILRLIFYFNPAIPEHTGSYPDDLACALSIKVLQLSESNRRMKHKLSFEEFVEAFLHALMLGLNLLQVQHGYFYDYLERLMTYVGDSPVRNAVGGRVSTGSAVSDRGERDNKYTKYDGDGGDVEDLESYEDSQDQGSSEEGEAEDSGCDDSCCSGCSGCSGSVGEEYVDA